MDGIRARRHRNREIVIPLEVQPILRRSAKQPGKTQRRVDRDAALAVYQFIHAGKRDADAFGELDLGQTVRFEELALKDRSGMHERYTCGHYGGSGIDQVPSTKYQVPSTKYQVPSTKYQVPIYNIHRYTL